ncbi:alpha/beta hydrolase [Rhodopirellula bahusiensis]|uniref:alpha/beta hydrolase n=2 Tax=Rhodopirellula bahusiensis TaxID=2014065 RepID=UPI0032643F13
MSSLRIPILTLALVALASTFFVAHPALAQRTRKPVVWVNADIPNMAGLEHKVLKSESLGHEVGYVVWTPPNFSVDSDVRYPVVYFLHGAGGSERSDAAGFASLMAKGIRNGTFPPAICVCPNGGMSGYRGEVESMIVDELIPLIDSTYPTQAKATSRIVAGFSMGGAGSVRLSLLHPELFCGAGSWGGALAFRGDPSESPLLPAAENNADTLRQNGYAALLINGDGDRPDAFELLAETFESVKIPHEIVVVDDTKHNLGAYQQKTADQMIKFLGNQLRQKPDR